MTIIKNKIFGSVLEPQNFVELIELLSSYRSSDKGVHMWRGQSNINWRIDHSAYRRLKIDKKEVTDWDLIWYEKSLMEVATHRGYRRQDGRELSDLELLAKLQHHGAATRLLDFTRNSLIALWFASSENIETDGLLIGLYTHYLGGHESKEDYYYPFELNKVDSTTHPYTFEPPIITPRIAAQHSQFIYSSLSTEKTGSIKLEKEGDANVFIAIKKSLKIEIIEILESSFDIRMDTLFPDIDGFGDANSHNLSSRKMWRW